MAVQAGFRTRHITTAAITDVCRNVTHSTDLLAKCMLSKYYKSSLMFIIMLMMLARSQMLRKITSCLFLFMHSKQPQIRMCFPLNHPSIQVPFFRRVRRPSSGTEEPNGRKDPEIEVACRGCNCPGPPRPASWGSGHRKNGATGKSSRIRRNPTRAISLRTVA